MNINDLDLGPTFQPEAERLKNLRAHQQKTNQGRFSYGISFLDDCLGGCYPGDLVLVAAKSGHGKTTLVTELARNALKQGKRVYCFALEAFEGELSARILYQSAAKRLKRQDIDFLHWWRGAVPELDPIVEKCTEELAEELANLFSIYKGHSRFANHELIQNLNEIRDKADVVILDHMHILDTSDSLYDQQRTIQLLLDFALVENIPVIAVSHVRKDDGKYPSILPRMEDLHGTSDLYKKALQVVIMGRDSTKTSVPGGTLFRIEKSRFGRASSDLVARVRYDAATARYLPGYELGQLEWSTEARGIVLQSVDDLPFWAKGAR